MSNQSFPPLGSSANRLSRPPAGQHLFRMGGNTEGLALDLPDQVLIQFRQPRPPQVGMDKPHPVGSGQTGKLQGREVDLGEVLEDTGGARSAAFPYPLQIDQVERESIIVRLDEDVPEIEILVVKTVPVEPRRPAGRLTDDPPFVCKYLPGEGRPTEPVWQEMFELLRTVEMLRYGNLSIGKSPLPYGPEGDRRHGMDPQFLQAEDLLPLVLRAVPNGQTGEDRLEPRLKGREVPLDMQDMLFPGPVLQGYPVNGTESVLLELLAAGIIVETGERGKTVAVEKVQKGGMDGKSILPGEVNGRHHLLGCDQLLILMGKRNI